MGSVGACVGMPGYVARGGHAHASYFGCLRNVSECGATWERLAMRATTRAHISALPPLAFHSQLSLNHKILILIYS